MVIRSTENATVKRVAKLKQKKYREESGSYIAEGERLIGAIAAVDASLIAELYLSETYYSAHSTAKFTTEPTVLSDIVFNKLAETENSQGILAVVRQNRPRPLGADRCLFLDRVRDPGNLGTIIRTATAFGFTDIVCNDCADVFAPKTVRSAMSGVAICNFPAMTVEEIKAAGYTLVCADMSGTPLNDYVPHGKLCLAIGNEANGISDEVFRAADVVLGIPMRQMESLNASVSAGIMMYQLK